MDNKIQELEYRVFTLENALDYIEKTDQQMKDLYKDMIEFMEYGQYGSSDIRKKRNIELELARRNIIFDEDIKDIDIEF